MGWQTYASPPLFFISPLGLCLDGFGFLLVTHAVVLTSPRNNFLAIVTIIIIITFFFLVVSSTFQLPSSPPLILRRDLFILIMQILQHDRTILEVIARQGRRRNRRRRIRLGLGLFLLLVHFAVLDALELEFSGPDRGVVARGHYWGFLGVASIHIMFMESLE